jgi:ribosome-binding factor A
MSHRLPQIESTLKRALATVLSQRLSDPRIEGMVSVTQVTVSPDLHDAYVYVSVLPAKYQSRTIYGLRHATGHIHQLVCREVSMRTVPRLEFRLDESLKRQAKIMGAIQRGTKRLPESGEAGQTPPDSAAADNASPDNVVSDPAAPDAAPQEAPTLAPEEPAP